MPRRAASRTAPRFVEYTYSFLLTIPNLNTAKRYTASIRNLVAFSGNPKLSDITAGRIEDFKEMRLEQAFVRRS